MTTLPIAIDYSAAATHWPGVGRYGRELVRALVRREDCPDLVLFERGRGERLPEAALGLAGFDARVRRVRVSGRGAWLRFRARYFGRGVEAALGEVGLVHRAFVDRPAFGARCELAQVQPLFELPDFEGGRGQVHSGFHSELAKRDLIVVGSEAGRGEVVSKLALDGAQVAKVITGADHWLRDAQPLSASQLAATGPPRLLVLGAISKSRSPQAVLQAFEALAAEDPSPTLHFDGRASDAAPSFEAALAQSPFQSRITWNPHPVEAELPRLVSESAVLIHLSQSELSPITPLEALHFGTSVVATPLPAFAEVLSAESLPEHQDEISKCLEVALNSAFDDDSRAARRAVASPYTWDACAADHIALWQRLATRA